MSLRIFSAGFLIALASCGGPPEGVAPGNTSAGQPAETGTPAGDPGERIACAVGDAPLAEECTVERVADAAGTLVTIRHPDGGFRRLRISADGRVTTADGALPAAVTLRDGVAEVAVSDARYRLTIAGR